MAVLIKHLETEDELQGKAYVHSTAWHETYAGLVDQAFLDSITLDWSLARARRARDLGIPTLLAIEDGQVVGFADYGPYRDEVLASTGEVYAIYILGSHYGQGVGRALMDAAVHELAEYSQVAVWVLAGNERAIRFYERYGFRFDGAEKPDEKLGPYAVERRMML